MTIVGLKLADSMVKYWRILVEQPNQADEKFDYKSLILGDWLRYGYISIGEDSEQFSRERFHEMQDGDKIAVVTDNHLWAVGEIRGFVYRIEDEHLHPVRRKVVWNKVTRIRTDELPEILTSKLKKPDIIVSLNEGDWNKTLEQIALFNTR